MKTWFIPALFLCLTACGNPQAESAETSAELSPLLRDYVLPHCPEVNPDTFEVLDFLARQSELPPADSNFIALYLPDELDLGPGQDLSLAGRLPGPQISLLLFGTFHEEVMSLSLVNYDSGGHVLGTAILSDSMNLPFQQGHSRSIRESDEIIRMERSFTTFRQTGGEFQATGRMQENRRIRMESDGSFSEVD